MDIKDYEELQRENLELRLKVKKLEGHKEILRVGINDWLNSYCPELCNDERVGEAMCRIGEYGTIGYIAKILDDTK